MIFNFIIFLVFICHVAATFEGIPKNWGQFETFHGKSMEKLFEKYKTVFGKKFLDTSDELSHFNNFKSKVASVFDWNDGKHSYTKGINHFTDLSPEERRHFVMADTKMIVSLKNLFNESTIFLNYRLLLVSIIL